MKCCLKCQDHKFCDDQSSCCKYCDHFSANGCLHGSPLKRDRLKEYENFKLTPSEFGDFYNAD